LVLKKDQGLKVSVAQAGTGSKKSSAISPLNTRPRNPQANSRANDLKAPSSAFVGPSRVAIQVRQVLRNGPVRCGSSVLENSGKSLDHR
jgi:hypothetical protein